MPETKSRHAHIPSVLGSPTSSASMSRREAITLLAGAAALSAIGSADGRRVASRYRFPGAGRAQVSYRWQNVRIGGGGFVTGIITHPHSNIVYARTDVGGAYRRDFDTHRWIPITDWVGGPDSSLSGIESLAVDPHHPDRVYIAAGMYTQRWAPDAVMLRSDDRGRSFQGVPVPFKCGGNEAGRFNGERLMLDPNEPEILFFGSRLNGLWKSTDAARSWDRVKSFPIPDGTQGVGVVSVVFNPQSGRSGSPTREIFVALSRRSDNLYFSSDAGKTWHLVPGQPWGLRPNHAAISPDGWMYISYGKQPGPNQMTNGALWKYHPPTAQWKDITPLHPAHHRERFGYGTVAVDAQRPGVLMTSTFCRWNGGDIIFRSTDGGEHWRAISPRHGGTWNVASAPWLYFHRLRPMVTNWIGSLQIDPHHSNRVWYTTGWGIFRCDNIMAADDGGVTQWAFDCNGFEETVINDLASPSRGAHLLSAMGDIGGFRHDELRISPPHGVYPHGCGSNTCIAVAPLQPDFMVRTFGGQKVNIAYSTSGGREWRFFPSQPPNAQYGRAAVNSNGSAIVWTPSSGAWNAPDRPVYYTHDSGRSWQASRGIAGGRATCADPINDQCFYAFDPRRGALIASRDAGAVFRELQTGLPHASGELRAAPGREGDLWLASGAGLYRVIIDGRHIHRCAAIHSAVHVGFGRAAPGEQYPAIYIVAVSNGVYGFYRSINAGVTWRRINDFNHQFFDISCIIGDPRIFGRVYLGTSGRGIIFGDIA